MSRDDSSVIHLPPAFPPSQPGQSSDAGTQEKQGGWFGDGGITYGPSIIMMKLFPSPTLLAFPEMENPCTVLIMNMLCFRPEKIL